MDGIGDPLFGLFARDFAPLDERLASITSRLEAIPRFLEEHRTRSTRPQVRLWQELEIESAEEMPGLLRRDGRGRRPACPTRSSAG